MLFNEMQEINRNYVVCANGKVYSKYHKRYLTQYVDNAGYHRVRLKYSLGKYKSFYVHRLVAFNYVKNRKGKPCINHKNGNKSDNRSRNLEWVTHKENSRHAVKSGLISNKHARFWDKSRLGILRFLSENYTQPEIAYLFDLSQARVSQLLKS